MKNKKIDYAVVGTFVIAMVAGLVIVVALLTGRTGATDTYVTRYADVSGLKFGTLVTYMGFPVGQVEEIEPVHEQGRTVFDLELSVREGWRIPKDSFARITAAGLLSAITIDIRAGGSGEALEPGARIRGVQEVNMIAALSDTANTVRDLAQNDLKPLLNDLTRYLASFGELVDRDVGDVVRNVGKVAERLAEEAPAIISDLRRFSQQMTATGERMEKLLGPENAARIDAALGNVALASDNLAARAPAILDNFHGFSAQMHETGKAVRLMLGPQSVERIDQALDNFARASGNFAQLTRDLGATRTELEKLVKALNALVVDNRGNVNESLSDLRHTLDTVAQHIDTVTYNLEGTSRNLYEFSRQLRDNPAVLIGGRPPPADAEAGRR